MTMDITVTSVSTRIYMKQDKAIFCLTNSFVSIIMHAYALKAIYVAIFWRNQNEARNA